MLREARDSYERRMEMDVERPLAQWLEALRTAEVGAGLEGGLGSVGRVFVGSMHSKKLSGG